MRWGVCLRLSQTNNCRREIAPAVNKAAQAQHSVRLARDFITATTNEEIQIGTAARLHYSLYI
jgi:hypothetical protein